MPWALLRPPLRRSTVPPRRRHRSRHLCLGWRRHALARAPAHGSTLALALAAVVTRPGAVLHTRTRVDATSTAPTPTSPSAAPPRR
ncbi:MAG: hypothetical protein R3F65_18155 [bacterium]